jgi:hypothetical protein
VANTELFQQAQTDAGDALTQMRALVKGAIDGIGQALPLFITNSRASEGQKASCQLNQIVGALVDDRVANGESTTWFGRLAYPERAEVTKHDMPGRKSPGCPAVVSQR